MLRIASAATTAGTDNLVGYNLSISASAKRTSPYDFNGERQERKGGNYLSWSVSAFASTVAKEHSSVDASLETFLGADAADGPGGGGCQNKRQNNGHNKRPSV